MKAGTVLSQSLKRLLRSLDDALVLDCSDDTHKNTRRFYGSIMSGVSYGTNFNFVGGRPTKPTPWDNEQLYVNNYDAVKRQSHRVRRLGL